jgi:hypothetical protein
MFLIKIIFTFVLILTFNIAFAIESFNLKLANINADSLQVKNIKLSFIFNKKNQAKLILSIDKLHTNFLKRDLTQIKLQCNNFKYTDYIITCNNATLYEAGKILFDRKQHKINFTYNKQAISITSKTLKIAGGYTSLNFNLKPNLWSLKLNAKKINLANLMTLLNKTFGIKSEFKITGLANFKLNIDSVRQQLKTSINGNFNNFSFANINDTQVGENLKLNFNLKSNNSNKRLLLSGLINLRKAEIYYEPVYIEHSGKPINLDFNLSWLKSKQNLKIHKLIYKHPKISKLDMQADFNLKNELKINKLSLNLAETSLNKFYTYYLKNWLDSKGFTDLKLDGILQINSKWRNDTGYINAKLNRVNLSNKSSNINNLNGNINWRSHNVIIPKQARRSTYLFWNNAKIIQNIKIGASNLNLSLFKDNVHLLTPLNLPVLDGDLKVNKFRFSNISNEKNRKMLFSGKLNPISMEAISKALGWSEILGGKISGKIPSISYTDKSIDIKGDLSIKVFDGEILINNTKLDNPHSSFPILSTDVNINKLDLHTLTRFFSFGDISGRLSGYIKNLRMLNWQATSFNAKLATPNDDDKKHKISQKALNNLSSLGGSSITDALSRSIIRIFKEFYYHKIGWQCILKNGICQMNGVENYKNGYYIVKGGGLPRIDIIGYNKQVNWSELWKSIKNATNVGPPVIK